VSELPDRERDCVGEKMPIASGTWKPIRAGVLSGIVATAFMSAIMLMAKRLGLMGEMPPEKITASLLDRAGWRSRGRRTQDALSAVSHLGFGAAAGVLFAAVERRPQPPLPAVPAGILFGAAVWFVSYQGWVPALGIMPPPSRDRPGRPPAMLAAHLVYGAVLGALISWSSEPRERNSSRADMDPHSSVHI